MHTRIAFDHLIALLSSSSEREELSPIHGVTRLVVDLSAAASTVRVDASLPEAPPCPVIALIPGDRDGEAHAIREFAQRTRCIDLVAGSEQELADIERGIEAQPHAASILVQLLRVGPHLPVTEALMAESLAYSALQHGASFKAWLAARGPARTTRDEPGPLVLVSRTDGHLSITLNRPDKRNAFSAALRDELHQALMLVAYDNTIAQAVVDGAGEGFCAGGDLTEFGEARDASAAHIARVTSNTGALLHRLRERVAFRIHGACIGAGIELPAFSGDVSAAPGAFFQLPEMSFGLIPGAGGTVSIPRRIGRHRAAYLAISGKRIDAPTALSWGLIDRIE